MSDHKREQTENFFKYHADTRLVEIIDGSGGVLGSFPALFDMASEHSGSDAGNVQKISYIPHLTFYSGHADAVRVRGTLLRIDEDTTKTWKVNRVDDDRTRSTFQAEAWLL